MSQYGKIINRYKVEIAPRNYKNTCNFNMNPFLMIKEGYKPFVVLYEKSTGKTCYFYEESVEQETYNAVAPGISLYTDIQYPGSPYEWNEEAQEWQIPLGKAKEMKAEEIRNAADETATAYRVGYSKSEQDTWERQEAAAKELNENPNSTSESAEWLRLLASTRGIAVEELVAKILRNVGVANNAAALILGYQQRLEDMIRACTTADEVLSITWNIEAVMPSGTEESVESEPVVEDENPNEV